MSSSNKTTSAPPDFSPPKDESFFQELPSAPAAFSLCGDGEPYVSKIADLRWRAINNSIGTPNANVVELHERCSAIFEAGRALFLQAASDIEGQSYGSSVREVMSAGILGQAEKLRLEVRDLTVRLVDAAKSSPLVQREDISDATTAMKTALAALRFKDYQRWDTEVLNDEDIVLGVRQAGQMEQNTTLVRARQRFEEAMQRLTDIAALLVPGQPVTVVGEDYRFGRMAVEEARMSSSEDEREHPLVGAVVVKDRRVLATAHRGEVVANHAEYIALERKLNNVSVTDCTVYTTLEPCTTRMHPKIPCADRLIERKVARDVIGMLDPNPTIRGRGMWKLQEANIAVETFPHELTRELQELNRKFIRSCLASEKGGQEVKKQLAAFMKQGQGIRHSLEYNNPSSVSEKTDWEQRIEQFLTNHLDESYAVQFRIPSREVTVYPDGMNLSMRVPWAEPTAKIARLSDFISKLRHSPTFSKLTTAQAGGERQRVLLTVPGRAHCSSSLAWHAVCRFSSNSPGEYISFVSKFMYVCASFVVEIPSCLTIMRVVHQFFSFLAPVRLLYNS